MLTTTLDTFFADTVARGWRPRTPAFEPELSALEASYCRGDCVSPLIQHGDIAYIDPHTPPQPGDLVSFALSARGAEAQNASLPKGQSPWKAGDHWTKLYAQYRGIPMLLDRHGSAATATLMCCEHPDDTPVLWPVRNVRRGGALLFATLGAGIALAGCDQVPMAPPCSVNDSVSRCAELGLDAATQIGSAFVTSDSIVASPGSGGPTGMTTSFSLSGMRGDPVAVDLSVGQTLLTVSGAVTAFSFTFAIYRDGASIGSSVTTATYNSTQFPPSAGITLPISPLTLSIVDPTPPTGTHVYRLTLASYSVTGGTSVLIDFKDVTMTVYEVRR